MRGMGGMFMSDANGGNGGNGGAERRELPVRKRRVPIFLRWSRMVELAQEQGLSTYVVRQAVTEGKIPKRFFGTRPRAFYARDDVFAFAESFLGETENNC
jgi:hypothetical protein